MTAAPVVGIVGAGQLARMTAQAALSLDVTVRAPRRRGGVETTGGFLFTHRGYSGPAVLDVSHLTTIARLDAAPALPSTTRTGPSPPPPSAPSSRSPPPTARGSRT